MGAAMMLGTLPHKPTIPDLVPYLRQHYARPGNGNGGCFHIVTEDPNPERHAIEWCLDQAVRVRDEGPGKYDGTCDDETVGLGIVMCAASTSQRRRLEAAWSFYPWTPG